METMAGKKPRRRRSFTPEFKAEVVALVRQPGKTAGGVAREMGLTETAVRAWVRQAELDEGVRNDGLTTAERAELALLRKELRETREERDILKRAVAFVCHERGRQPSSGRRPEAVLHRRWRRALRSRPAGGGCKPPQGASVKSRGAERCGKGETRARQVGARKASESEPLMTCRNADGDIETEV